MSNKYYEAHICQCLTRFSTALPNSVLTVMGNSLKTRMQFVERVLGLARGLLDLGLRPGHVVALSALNSDLYLEWLLAVAFVGGISAPLNYRWSLEEARSALEVACPTMLVTDTGFQHWHSELHADSIPSLKWQVLMDMPVQANATAFVLTTEALNKPLNRPPTIDYSWAPDGAAIICFTSGTTGKPKGVTISHSALVIQSLAKIASVGYCEDDVYLHTAPLCHIGGISSAMAMLMAGGCHILIQRFEAKLAIQAMEHYRVTSLITVPAIMADVTAYYRMQKTVKGSEGVKKILNGGGSLSVELLSAATKTFPRAKIISAYGMTEACSSLTFMTLYDPSKENYGVDFQLIDDPEAHIARIPVGVCVGKPAPHVDLRISIEDSSDTGRILTRGPHVMLGYWGQVPGSDDMEGWLDTGDIGHIDHRGNVWLIGRSKDRIKSGGENIYPEEVEMVLRQHPGIASVVVVGLPDSRLTEMVVGCIMLKDDWQWVSYNTDKANDRCLSFETLHQFCRGKNLTSFKIPKRYILWTGPFPVTTTGKVRRDKVKATILSHNHLLSNL